MLFLVDKMFEDVKIREKNDKWLAERKMKWTLWTMWTNDGVDKMDKITPGKRIKW